MGAERRYSTREVIAPLEVTGLTSLDHKTLLSRTANIVDASASGFLIHLKRADLLPKNLRESLSLHTIEGDRILLTIPTMDLEMGGRITRTKRIDKETYEVAIDFSEDAPEYWRECLMDLLPRPGDLD